MKIGFVYDDSLDRPDGVTQYVLRVGKWLSAQGHEVHYLVGQTTRSDIAHVHSLSRNLNVKFNGNRLTVPYPAAKRPIRRLLAAERFDVLHVQVPYSPLMAGKVIAAAPKSTAIVGTFHIAPHSPLVTIATKALALWSRPTLKKFDRLVSGSTAAAAFAYKTFGKRTNVIPMVVDYKRFQSAQAMAEYNDGVLNILFLGRLVERKGCLTLLLAIAELRSRGADLPPFRVIICGGGPLEESLHNFVRQQKLEDIVFFKGRIDEADKPRYYASADIACFPSSGGESFGIVLIEAMANGKTAVLGGNNPGYATVLGGNPDLLFPATDYAVLADKLTLYLTDAAQRQSAAAWGHREAAQYDVRVVGQTLLDMYTAVANTSSSTS